MFPPKRIVEALLPTSTASNATATAQIDTLGFDHVSIGVNFSSAASGTNLVLALKVGEADVTNTSSAADITALVGGGVGGFTLPTQPTATGTANVFQLDVDTRHRKRYLLVSVTPFTTANVGVVAVLSSPEQGPLTAAQAGLLGRASA